MTTTFQTALTSPNYTSLRGSAGNVPWAGNQYITLCKNTVVFAGQVVTAPASPLSVASFAYHNVSVGAYTAVEQGETILVSHDSNIRHAYWRGRARKAADSSLVYINETSINLTINDYFWVVYDFDQWDVLSRMVGSAQYWDYDIAYHPLAPVSAGLQTAYINWDPADGAYRIAFDVRSSYATDQYSTPSLSYQFTFVGGTYSVFSGSLSSPLVTVDFTANTEQWGKLVVTDSQGTTTTRRFYIRAHGSTDAPAPDFTGAQITGNIDSGWNATVSAWSGVDSVLDQTFTVIWSKEWYNNVAGPIFNNIDMVGRFHHETNQGHGDPLYSYVTDVQFDIEGICTQLQRLQMQDLTTIDKPTAAVVDEISFNTPQRSIVYYLATHSTALTLCDLTFPNGFDLTYLFQYVPNQGGNIRDAVQGIAKQWNANVEFAPDGRIQVVIDTRFLADKSGVVDVADWNNEDFITVNLPVDPVNKTGRLDAYGASYDSGNLLADRSRAPGTAQGYAAGQSTLDAQILKATTNQISAQAELNYRAGQQMAIENLTYTQDWKAAHGGYHFLIPSRGQRVTHTLMTDTNVRGLSFSSTDYWQVISITINHNNDSGAREVTTTEELEPPPGDPGDTVPQIAGGTQTNPTLLQPADPFPALPDNPANYLPDDPTPNPYPPLIPPKNGNTGIYTDGTIVDTSRSLLRRIPVWTGATPSSMGSYVPKAVCFDLTTINPPIGAYSVWSDGTNSVILYTADAFAKPAVWIPTGTPFAGVYTQIASASTPGSVLVYTNDPSQSTTSYDFTKNNQGFTVVTQSGVAPDAGTYVASTGWEAVDSYNTPDDSRDNELFIQKTFSSPEAITGAKITFDRSVGAITANVIVRIEGFLSGSSQFQQTSGAPGPTGANAVYEWSGSATIDKIQIDMSGGNCSGVSCTPGGSVLLLRLDIITGGSGANVRYSSDYGATVGSSVAVGSTPGTKGAFDLLRIGAASFAAAAGQAKVATTLGGSYSNAAGGTLSAGNPVVLVVPYRRWTHGAVQSNTTDSDYLLGGDQLISGASLWLVNGVTGGLTDVTPTTGAVCIGSMLATVWQSSAVCKLAIVVNVSGVNKLYTSVNGGTSWTFRRNVTTPIYLRCRRNDLYGAQLYLLDGDTLYVSLNWGVTWNADTLPSAGPAVNMDLYN